MATDGYLSTYYNSLNFATVTVLSDFYKTNLPEVSKLRSLTDNIKLLFKVPAGCVSLQVAEGESVYRYIIQSPDVNKSTLGWIVYLPKERRLDLYSPDSPQMPLIQWKGRKAVWKGYAQLFDRAGLDKLFERIVNVI